MSSRGHGGLGHARARTACRPCGGSPPSKALAPRPGSRAASSPTARSSNCFPIWSIKSFATPRRAGGRRLRRSDGSGVPARGKTSPMTENHIKQLHRDLLVYSEKDERHRGSLQDSRQTTWSPSTRTASRSGSSSRRRRLFDTPRLMDELVELVQPNAMERQCCCIHCCSSPSLSSSSSLFTHFKTAMVA